MQCTSEPEAAQERKPQPATKGDDPATRLRRMAEQLDCFLEQDVRELAGVTESTLEAWNKRHSGPPYIRFGNVNLYPRDTFITFLQSKKRERQPLGKALL